MLRNNQRKKSTVLLLIAMALVMVISTVPANTVSAKTTSKTLKVGSTVTDKYTKAKYKVTGKKTVTYVKTTDTKKTTITVPACINVGNKNYNVTAIAKNAFKSNKKATKIVIGENVSKIAKGAFNSCSKVKVLTIRSTKLKSKNISKSALTGLKKSVTVYVPSGKKTSYKKILGRTVKVCKHKYKKKTVYGAWSEKVVDKEAYDETVVDQEAYDEQVLDHVQWTQRDTGDDVSDLYGIDLITWCDNHNCPYHAYNYDSSKPGYCGSNATGKNVYKTEHHEAVTHTVHHDATYKTVNHPAETHTETYCTTCGATK
jgi:hypothetical protein